MRFEDRQPDREMQSTARMLKSVTLHRELWRLMFQAVILFFLMDICRDVELVIHKFAQRF